MDKRLFLESSDPKKIKSSRCFIATASYGSPIAPEVIMLQSFRDEVLLPSKLGRMLIVIYYLVSPSLASLISEHKYLQALIRGLLLKPVLYIINKRKRRGN
jgi:hypothetical protein